MNVDLEFAMFAVNSYGPNGPTKTINSVAVCLLIKGAGLWANIPLRLTQIQTVGIAMVRLPC